MSDPGMNIVDVEWCLYETGKTRKDGTARVRCATRITTEGGARGWSDFAYHEHLADGTGQRWAEELLAGRNALDRDTIWDDVHETVPREIVNMLDVALWDLWGRAEDKPVHALIGTERERVPAYVSTPFNMGEPEDYAEYAVEVREAGFHGFKIHPYIDIQEWNVTHVGFPDRDIETYRAVRDAVGPDFACMTDNYCSYSYEEAVRVGQAVDELGYEWYESPMMEHDGWMERYVRLRREMETPVCAPELAPDSYATRIRWMDAGACDICRIDVGYGGLTACLRLAHACEERGVPLEIHTGGPYHLQVLAACSGDLIKYCETFSTNREERIGPGRTNPGPVPDEEGYVPVPQTPGMGAELDWDYIAAHRTE